MEFILTAVLIRHWALPIRRLRRLPGKVSPIRGGGGLCECGLLPNEPPPGKWGRATRVRENNSLMAKLFHRQRPRLWDIGCCSPGTQRGAAAWTAKTRGAFPFSPELFGSLHSSTGLLNVRLRSPVPATSRANCMGLLHPRHCCMSPSRGTYSVRHILPVASLSLRPLVRRALAVFGYSEALC